MIHIFLILFMLIGTSSIAHAGCPNVPSKDFDRLQKSWISEVKYAKLGRLGKECWYFRDIVFKNNHGQQAVVVASSKGRCLGFFRTGLADRAEIVGVELLIKANEGGIYKVDLSKGLPKSIYFDGNISNFERCLD